MDKVHLVLGPAGSLGSAVVAELLRRDEPVRVLCRSRTSMERLFPGEVIGTVEGSVLEDEALDYAFYGVGTVYNCLNLPYPRWRELPAMHEQVLKHAARHDARLVFPGNVYNYGLPQSRPVSEEHPQAADTRKGRLRIALEERLWQAHYRGEVPVFILRLPDFYGPRVLNNLVRPVFQVALTGGSVLWPGNPDADHEFVFVEDAARAMVDLAAQDRAYGEVIHLPGPGPITARRWIELAFEAAGTELKGIRPLGRTLAGLLGLINREVAELKELLYLFEEPLLLDGAKYRRLFGDYPATPYEEGVRRTVEWFREFEPPLNTQPPVPRHHL